MGRLQPFLGVTLNLTLDPRPEQSGLGPLSLQVSWVSGKSDSEASRCQSLTGSNGFTFLSCHSKFVLGSPVYPGLRRHSEKVGHPGCYPISVSVWPSGSFFTGSLGPAWAAIHHWEDQSVPSRPPSRERAQHPGLSGLSRTVPIWEEALPNAPQGPHSSLAAAVLPGPGLLSLRAATAGDRDGAPWLMASCQSTHWRISVRLEPGS